MLLVLSLSVISCIELQLPPLSMISRIDASRPLNIFDCAARQTPSLTKFAQQESASTTARHPQASNFWCLLWWPICIGHERHRRLNSAVLICKITGGLEHRECCWHCACSVWRACCAGELLDGNCCGVCTVNTGYELQSSALLDRGARLERAAELTYTVEAAECNAVGCRGKEGAKKRDAFWF